MAVKVQLQLPVVEKVRLVVVKVGLMVMAVVVVVRAPRLLVKLLGMAEVVLGWGLFRLCRGSPLRRIK